MDLKDAQKRWNDSIQLCKLIAACFVVFIHVMLPGAIGGSLLTMIPAMRSRVPQGSHVLLRLSLFTSLLNMAAALA